MTDLAPDAPLSSHAACNISGSSCPRTAVCEVIPIHLPQWEAAAGHWQNSMRKNTKTKQSADLRKIVLVDDHPVFREGLAQILDAETDLAVCGQAGDAASALKLITRLQPDLALVDISLPGESGLKLIKRLRAMPCELKILVVSMHDEAFYANRALRAGADGYIMKQEDPEEIVQAVRDVLEGRIYVSEQVTASNASAPPAASSRESSGPLDQISDLQLEVLELIGHGKSNAEIAAHLRLDARTVASHHAQIQKKLKLKSGHDLLRYAVRWVESQAT